MVLPGLGVLSLVPGSAQEAAGLLDEACVSMRAMKGFGRWSLPEQELLLYAAALLALRQSGVTGEVRERIAALTCAWVLRILAAQQAAAASAGGSGVTG